MPDPAADIAAPGVGHDALPQGADVENPLGTQGQKAAGPSGSDSEQVFILYKHIGFGLEMLKLAFILAVSFFSFTHQACVCLMYSRLM